MYAEEKNIILIDNGSFICKGGFAGEDAPRAIFPTTLLTIPKTLSVLEVNDQKEKYLREETTTKRGVLNLRCPNAINWDDMEKIWHHCYYNELSASPEEYPAHLTEVPMNPKQNREKMTEIFFETFSVPNFYLSVAPVLTLYASGRLNGFVLESGHGATYAVPIYEGYNLPFAIMKSDLAGRQLNEYLIKLLNESCNMSSIDNNIARTIKESFCYVALDFENEMKEYAQSPVLDKTYGLPDGKVITLENQRIRCPETLFRPIILGKEYSGIHELTFQSILKCDIDLRKELYSSIILSGGNTMFPGISERLYKELIVLAPSNLKIKVIAPPERKLSAWIGGSIISSMNTFSNKWITKEEYEELGPQIVHQKCF